MEINATTVRKMAADLVKTGAEHGISEDTFREKIESLRDAYLDEREQRQNLKEEVLDLRKKLAQAESRITELEGGEIEALYHCDGFAAWKKGSDGKPHGDAFCANCLEENVRVRLTDFSGIITCSRCKAGTFNPKGDAFLNQFK